MKSRILNLIFVLFSSIASAQIVLQVINCQAIVRDSNGNVLNAGWKILVKSFAISSPFTVGSGIFINLSSVVQFGTVVYGKSDNNSLLIHLNIK